MSPMSGSSDHDGLEAALERGVGLDVLAVLVERGRADGAQLAARQHRLQQVRGVDRALGGAGADDRVQLVDEEDDPALAGLDLAEHGLEPLLELAPVLGAREERADVERDHAAVAERLGDVAGHDALGEALDDRGLADAGIADQHRVVLGPAREDLDHAADLLVAADHRVELAASASAVRSRPNFSSACAVSSGFGESGDVRADDLVDRLLDRAAVGEQVGDARLASGEGEQQVLGRDRLPALRRGLALGGLKRRDQAARGTGLGRVGAADHGQVGDGLLDAAAKVVEVDADPLQHRNREAVGLAEESEEQVRRASLGVPRSARGLLRRGDGLLALDGESVRLHAAMLAINLSLYN